MTKRAASPARTSRTTADPVTADDVAAWLQAAGAVKPSANPVARAATAELVNDYRLAGAEWAKMQKDDARTARAFNDAHAAVNKLRKKLPAVIARYAAAATVPSMLFPDEARGEAARRAGETARMLSALADVPLWPEATLFLDGWHALAVCLYRDAGTITGRRPTLTPNGQAIQFTRAGLYAAGHPRLEPGTIAQAIRRHVTYKSAK